jgi:hypothetical protein
MIGLNSLDEDLDADMGRIGGSSLFHASNAGRRFSIDASYRPEFDPEGSFVLTVTYQPWPRTERGRRRKDVPFAFDDAAEVVHDFETRSYRDLLSELDRWIVRCTLWAREEN